MNAERRYLVSGRRVTERGKRVLRVLEQRVSLLVWATDEQHAAELCAGLADVEVVGANRAMARERGIYGPDRRRPRRMAVPRSRT